jgi:Ni,Fe-hydrogenase III component G
MNLDSTLQMAGILLEPWAKDTRAPEPNRLDISIEALDLSSAVAALSFAHWGYLSAITGLDLGAAAGSIEVLYHFCAGAAVATLRVRTPRAAPSVPSICRIMPSASFFERELSEMFGVAVVDTPNPDRLFLPDDWPAYAYPMRKDFEMKP